MGRQGPRLVPFLKKGLTNRSYRNLIYEDPSNLTFSIILPHKTKNLCLEDECMFKEWYKLNNKKYIFASKHYTIARQAILASLRKSDYVEKRHISEQKFTFRILTEDEVKEKKRLKKELKKEEVSDIYVALSPDESGSGVNSPPSDHTSIVSNDHVLSVDIEFSNDFPTMESNNLLKANDVQQSMHPDEYDGFIKPEPCFTFSEVSDENQHFLSFQCPVVAKNVASNDVAPEFKLTDKWCPIVLPQDTCISAVPDLTSNWPFDDYLESANYFPESHSLDMMECPMENPKESGAGFSEECSAENRYELLADNLESADTFPESHSFDLMEYSTVNPKRSGSGFIEDLPAENAYDFLQLVGLSEEDLDKVLLKKFPEFNLDHSLACKKNVNHAAETRNAHDLPAESENVCNNFMKEVLAINSHQSVANEQNSLKQISLSLDAGLPGNEIKARQKVYFCMESIHVGKIPILLCDFQFETKSVETSGEIRIVYGETIAKKINGWKSVKELKFIDDHLMVFLEPMDD